VERPGRQGHDADVPPLTPPALPPPPPLFRHRHLANLVETLPVRCLRRFALLGGRDRGLAIAGQAFLAVIPFLVVVAAFTASDGATAAGDKLVSRFHLSGGAADSVRQLFQRQPGEHSPITGVGLLILALSLLSFSRALQRTWELAWQLPPKSWRGSLGGVAAVALLFLEILLLAVLAGLLHPGVLGSVLLYPVRAAIAVPFLLGLQYLLLNRRVPARNLVPGAIVLAAGQALVSVGSKVWMPHLVSHNAERYGTIGVTLALLSWLIILSVVLVAGVATSAELSFHPVPWRRRTSPPPASPAPKNPASSPPEPQLAPPTVTDPDHRSRPAPSESAPAGVPASPHHSES
jgi:membrane protein